MARNKAQGQSFRENLRIDLREDYFCHDQLHLALPRAIHQSDIVVLNEREDRKPENIVHLEVLSTNYRTLFGIPPLNATMIFGQVLGGFFMKFDYQRNKFIFIINVVL